MNHLLVEDDMIRRILALITLSVITCSPEFLNAQNVDPAKKVLPAGTQVYLVLEEGLSGEYGKSQVGQLVRCKVWRDVAVGNTIFIKAGTPALAKIDSIERAFMFGKKGKMSIAAYETKTVDQQIVQLEGGYMKEGKSRMALSLSLAIFLYPLLVPGKAAELPQGMVFDAYTVPDMLVRMPEESMVVSMVTLSSALSRFSAEVLMENLEQEKKPKVFKLKIIGDGSSPAEFVIDSVNGKSTIPLPLKIMNANNFANGYEVFAEIKIKKLVKQFQNGINRFEVSYKANGKRIATEVILNIQI